MAKIPDESLPAFPIDSPQRGACHAFPRNSAGHRTPAHITQNGEACPVSAQSERCLAREARSNRQPIYTDIPILPPALPSPHCPAKKW